MNSFSSLSRWRFRSALRLQVSSNEALRLRSFSKRLMWSFISLPGERVRGKYRNRTYRQDIAYKMAFNLEPFHIPFFFCILILFTHFLNFKWRISPSPLPRLSMTPSRSLSPTSPPCLPPSTHSFLFLLSISLSFFCLVLRLRSSSFLLLLAVVSCSWETFSARCLCSDSPAGVQSSWPNTGPSESGRRAGRLEPWYSTW